MEHNPNQGRNWRQRLIGWSKRGMHIASLHRKTAWACAVAVVMIIVTVTAARLASNDNRRKTKELPDVRGGDRLYAAAAYAAGGSTSMNGMDLWEGEEAAIEADDSYTDETARTDERMIIRTVQLTIKSRQYETDLLWLKTRCGELGGWISASSENEDSKGLRNASLTLRIPSLKLDTFMDGAGQIGHVLRREESADDVTASYQDTEMRLSSQRTLMSRLQALASEAADLQDLLALEKQIAETQYKIDTLQQSLHSTERQVQYSSIHITLYEEAQDGEQPEESRPLPARIWEAFKAGWSGLMRALADGMILLASAFPSILMVLAAAVILRGILGLVRRIRKR